MDERRFRAALEAIAKTIYSYGEDEIFAALGVIADRFGWELAMRDPGPEEENPEFWTDEECADPNCACHRIGKHWKLTDPDRRLIDAAFNLPSDFKVVR